MNDTYAVAQPTPQQIKIHDNLDELDRDSSEVREPYGFVWGGNTLVASDPADKDWQELMDSDGELAVLKSCLSDEDLGKFLAVRAPGWKLRELVRRFLAHFGIEEPGKAG